MKIIIEGIDRLGKDTLVDGLINSLGWHAVVHFSSPKNFDFYKTVYGDAGAPEQYQRDSFFKGFQMIDNPSDFTNQNIIYNRFHLGEYVYSQRYRGYSGDYVFDTEKLFPHVIQQARLILLYTSDLHIMTDDGKSHDFSKRGDEQKDFLEAFEMSNIKHKYKVNVYNSFSDTYRAKADILSEVLVKIKNGD